MIKHRARPVSNRHRKWTCSCLVNVSSDWAILESSQLCALIWMAIFLTVNILVIWWSETVCLRLGLIYGL